MKLVPNLNLFNVALSGLFLGASLYGGHYTYALIFTSLLALNMYIMQGRMK